jgi:hypothetical protein
MLPFFQTIAMLVNALSLMMLGFDRYMSFVRLTKGNWEPEKLLCNTILIFVWGLAVGISSPSIGMYNYILIHVKTEDVPDLEIDPYIYSAHFCAHTKVRVFWL